MTASLLAIVFAALLLPGMLAARAFFQAARTVEVEPSVPALSSIEGIALVGTFSLAVHLVYVVLLSIVAAIPGETGLPLADPYRVLAGDATALAAPNGALAFFLGLAWLCLLAFAIGRLAGRITLRRDQTIFYGPLTSIISAASGPNRVVTAYIVTKLQGEGHLGYQGTVTSLVRDGSQYPVKITLKNATPFRLTVNEAGIRRHVAGGAISWIVLTAEDWHNIAFRVFELEPPDDDG